MSRAITASDSFSRRTPRLGGAFGLLWTGQTVSLLGDQITLIALPLLAIADFSASSFDVGVLGGCLRLPYLLLGLPAGVWVDRLGLNRAMIGADLLRGLTVAAVATIAVIGGAHSPYALWALAFLAGVGAVFFQVSYQSYVPVIVHDPAGWHAANTRLSLSESMSLLLGPAVGGAVVAATAPSDAMAIDSSTYAASVATLLAIDWLRRRSSAAPEPPAAMTGGIGRAIADGWHYVRRQPVLNCIMWTGAAYNLGAAMYDAIVIVFGVRALHLGVGQLGLAIGIGGIGFPIGSLLAQRVTNRLGLGPSLLWAAVPSVGGMFVSASAPHQAAAACIATGTCLVGIGQGCFAVNAITLRQLASPPTFRARATAVHRFTSWGMLPVGAILGGVVAQSAGLRIAMLVSAILAATCAWPLLRSPLRSVRSAADVGVLRTA